MSNSVISDKDSFGRNQHGHFTIAFQVEARKQGEGFRPLTGEEELALLHASGAWVGPDWEKALRSKGERSYEHHALEPHRLCFVNLVSLETVPESIRYTGGLHEHATKVWKYNASSAGLAGPLKRYFHARPHIAEMLIARNIFYIGFPHDRIAALGNHKRLSFELGPHHPLAETQKGDFWKVEGAVAFPSFATAV